RVSIVAMSSAIEATHNPTTQEETGRDGNALVVSGGAGFIAGPDRARGRQCGLFFLPACP
ncbi:MAG: hypothetical protein ABGX04_08135, partial [Myxococcales bacterium]